MGLPNCCHSMAVRGARLGALTVSSTEHLLFIAGFMFNQYLLVHCGFGWSSSQGSHLMGVHRTLHRTDSSSHTASSILLSQVTLHQAHIHPRPTLLKAPILPRGTPLKVYSPRPSQVFLQLQTVCTCFAEAKLVIYSLN